MTTEQDMNAEEKVSETPNLLDSNDPFYKTTMTPEERSRVTREWAKQQRTEEAQSGSAIGQQIALDDKVSQMTSAEKIGEWATGTNIAKRAYDRVELEANSLALGVFMPEDKNFDVEAEFEKVKDVLHPDLWERATESKNIAELEAVMNLSKEQEYARAVMKSSGANGDLMPALLANIVDVDIALAFLSGGSYLGPKAANLVGKATAFRSGRAVSIGYGAGTGVEVAAIGELGNRALGMGYEAQDLPGVLAAGLVFGTGFGALTRLEKHATKVTKEKLATQKLRRAGWRESTPEASPVAARDAEVTVPPKPVEGEAPKTAPKEDFRPDLNMDESAGAAKVNATFGRTYSSATADISKESEKRLADLGYEWDGTPDKTRSKWDKAVDSFEDTVNLVPWLRLDSDIMHYSKAPTAVLLSMDLMESASGRHRVGMTAAVDKMVIESQISKAVAVTPKAYQKWLLDNGMSRFRDNKLNRKKFYRAVQDEMDARARDFSASTPTTRATNPHVKAAADALDADYKAALNYMQQRGVVGADVIPWTPGWTPQRWSGEALNALVDRGVAMEQIELGLTSGYLRANPAWSRKAANVTAKAVVSRMMHQQDGIDTNIYRILQQDGKAALKELYVRSGMSEIEFENFFKLLEPSLEQRGKAKILKSRNDIDMSAEIPGTQFTVRDLTNGDLMRVHSQYARSASGHAAMAGKGIQSKLHWDRKWDAIKDELAVNEGKMTGNKAGHFTPEDTAFKEYLWQAMTGGAINGRVNPFVRRMVATSNLSLMNQVGFAQAAETANIVAANGFESFVDYLRSKKIPIHDPNFRKSLDGGLQELASPIEGLHNLQRPDLQLDEIPVTAYDAQNLAAKDKNFRNFLDTTLQNGGTLDQMLGGAQHIQGYVSGMYPVRHFQHMMHDKTFIHALGRHLQGNKKFSAARLKDLGFTPELIAQLQKDWAHVKYDGRVISELNIQNWSTDSVAQLRNIMTRSRYQNVQEKLFGEGMFWMSSDLGTVLGNLRSFTLLGLKKQTIRHARIADARSTSAVLMGVPFAGLVSWVRDTVNGREDKYDPVRIMNRAWNYSAVTGPMSMISDPILGVLGLGEYQTGLGASERTSPSPFMPSIPAVETANRLAGIPSSMFDIVSGNATSQDVGNLSALPFGNAIGFNAIFNSWKSDIKAEKALKKSTERKHTVDGYGVQWNPNSEVPVEQRAAIEKQLVQQSKAQKAKKDEIMSPLNTLEKL